MTLRKRCRKCGQYLIMNHFDTIMPIYSEHVYALGKTPTLCFNTCKTCHRNASMDTERLVKRLKKILSESVSMTTISQEKLLMQWHRCKGFCAICRQALSLSFRHEPLIDQIRSGHIVNSASKWIVFDKTVGFVHRGCLTRNDYDKSVQEKLAKCAHLWKLRQTHIHERNNHAATDVDIMHEQTTCTSLQQAIMESEKHWPLSNVKPIEQVQKSRSALFKAYVAARKRSVFRLVPFEALTFEMVKDAFVEQNGKCHLCRGELSDHDTISIDRINSMDKQNAYAFPSETGPRKNFTLVHWHCNHKRASQELIEWLDYCACTWQKDIEILSSENSNKQWILQWWKRRAQDFRTLYKITLVREQSMSEMDFSDVAVPSDVDSSENAAFWTEVNRRIRRMEEKRQQKLLERERAKAARVSRKRTRQFAKCTDDDMEQRNPFAVRQLDPVDDDSRMTSRQRKIKKMDELIAKFRSDHAALAEREKHIQDAKEKKDVE